MGGAAEGLPVRPERKGPIGGWVAAFIEDGTGTRKAAGTGPMM